LAQFGRHGLHLQEPLLFYSCCFEDLHFRQSAQCAHSNIQALKAVLDKQLARVALLTTLSGKVRTPSVLRVDAIAEMKRLAVLRVCGPHCLAEWRHEECSLGLGQSQKLWIGLLSGHTCMKVHETEEHEQSGGGNRKEIKEKCG